MDNTATMAAKGQSGKRIPEIENSEKYEMMIDDF